MSNSAGEKVYHNAQEESSELKLVRVGEKKRDISNNIPFVSDTANSEEALTNHNIYIFSFGRRRHGTQSTN